MLSRVRVVSFLTCLLLFASLASGQIVAPGSDVAGKSIGEWTHEWWRWSAPVPSPIWPAFLEDGWNGPPTIRQEGPVFFLPDNAGSQITFGCFDPDCPTGPTTSHTFEVPSDKHLLVPIYAVMGRPDDGDAAAHADMQVSAVSSLFFSLNGESIESSDLLANYREQAGDYSISTPSFDDNIYFLDAGDHQLASDGYWMMLEPLPPGEHVVEYGGLAISEYGDFPINMRANITSVVPEPSSAVLLLSAAAAMSCRSRRRVRSHRNEARGQKA